MDLHSNVSLEVGDLPNLEPTPHSEELAGSCIPVCIANQIGEDPDSPDLWFHQVDGLYAWQRVRCCLVLSTT